MKTAPKISFKPNEARMGNHKALDLVVVLPLIRMASIVRLHGLGYRLVFRTHILQPLLFALFLSFTPAALAQRCVFPDLAEACEGDECTLDFETDDPDETGQISDVILHQRRARARAEGAVANTRRAFAEVGVQFRLATDLSSRINIKGHYDGLIRGGTGQAFGSFRVSVILRNLDTDEVLINRELDDGTQEAGPALAVSGNVEDEILQDLSKGITYALSLQIRAAARGLGLGRSDFLTGVRGLYMNSFSISGVNHSDADGDGLPDEWELEGVRDCEGNLLLNLPALGADPEQKDLFVELDWIDGYPPSKHTIAAVKSAFLAAPEDAGGGQGNPNNESGIRLHIDTGTLIDPLLPEDSLDIFNTCNDGLENGDGDGMDAADPDCRIGDDLGGGEAIDPDDLPNGATVPGVKGDTDGDAISDFLELKALFFDENRRFAFRYGIVTPATRIDCPNDPIEDPDDPAECFTRGGQAKGVNFVIVNDAPGTLMHEIGHTLGLGHGGPSFAASVILDPDTGEPIVPEQSGINCKPNYISIMNYALRGLKQANQVGQDLNGDGQPDGEIIDFSPPRFLVSDGSGSFKVARSLAPLASLDESCLDETEVLDPGDPENMIAFTDALGDDHETPVNAPIDWDGDPNTQDSCVSANVNLAFTERCREDPDQNAMPEGQGLAGAHDWNAIVMNPRKRGEGFEIELDVPEPTVSELEAIRRERDRADLEIVKEVEPATGVAGQPVVFTLTVRNNGPSHVTAAEVIDRVPSEIEVLSFDDNCVEMPENTVTCPLGNLHPEAERTMTIEGRVRVDLACEGRQFYQLINSAQVTNVRGSDPDAGNNHVRTSFDVLCVGYEYPAKSICGEQADPERIDLLSGRYGSAVNIHNPNDEHVHFFAKFASAVSPLLQPVTNRTVPLGLFSLDYDESLVLDCELIRDQLFDGAFPGGLVDGYLVLQSPRELDVDAVYTGKGSRASGDPDSALGTIDVERVEQRDRSRLRRPLPDLRPVTLTCMPPSPGQGNFPQEIDLEIENSGNGNADRFEISVRFGEVSIVVLSQPQLESGERSTHSVPIPEQCRHSCKVDIIIDSKGEIGESNEHNNQATTTCLPLPG